MGAIEIEIICFHVFHVLKIYKLIYFKNIFILILIFITSYKYFLVFFLSLDDNQITNFYFMNLAFERKKLLYTNCISTIDIKKDFILIYKSCLVHAYLKYYTYITISISIMSLFI